MQRCTSWLTGRGEISALQLQTNYIRIMKIIKHYVTANRSDEIMEFLGYGKDEKGWFHITEEPETEEEKEELYSSFVIF